MGEAAAQPSQNTMIGGLFPPPVPSATLRRSPQVVAKIGQKLVHECFAANRQ